MGDRKVPLPDVDTTNPAVVSQYGEWIAALVKEYSIDGLRIDGTPGSTSRSSTLLTPFASGEVCISLLFPFTEH